MDVSRSGQGISKVPRLELLSRSPTANSSQIWRRYEALCDLQQEPFPRTYWGTMHWRRNRVTFDLLRPMREASPSTIWCDQYRNLFGSTLEISSGNFLCH